MFFLYLYHWNPLFIKAIADTGAFSSAMSQKHFQKIKKYNQHGNISVAKAFLHQSPILFTVKLNFKIGHITLDEFLIFENLSSTLLGLLFFQRHKFILDPHNRLLHLLEFPFQLNTMKMR